MVPAGVTASRLALTAGCFAPGSVPENNAKELLWWSRAGVSLGLQHNAGLHSAFKALTPAASITVQLGRERRQPGRGVRRLWPEVVGSWHWEPGTDEGTQHPPSLQAHQRRALGQPSPLGCPIRAPSLAVGQAVRCGSTFRAAVSQREKRMCPELWHSVLP